MNNEQTSLVRRLLASTTARKLDWKPSASETAFQVSFKNSAVKIDRQDSGDNDPDTVAYRIELLDKDGNIVESFTDFALDVETFGKHNQEYFKVMGDLYEMARRRALGADKIMREILSELGDEEISS